MAPGQAGAARPGSGRPWRAQNSSGPVGLGLISLGRAGLSLDGPRMTDGSFRIIDKRFLPSGKSRGV